MKKNYKNSILALLFLMFTLNIMAQDGRSFWTATTKGKASKKQLNFRKTEPVKAQYYTLDIQALKNY